MVRGSAKVDGSVEKRSERSSKSSDTEFWSLRQGADEQLRVNL